jgi:Haem-degrading
MQAFRNTFLAAAATLALTAGVASAQDINKFVLSDAAAKKTLNKYEINADTARKIIDKCIDIATKANMPITIYILSPTGQIVAAHRMEKRA